MEKAWFRGREERQFEKECVWKENGVVFWHKLTLSSPKYNIILSLLHCSELLNQFKRQWPTMITSTVRFYLKKH